MLCRKSVIKPDKPNIKSHKHNPKITTVITTTNKNMNYNTG